MLDETICAIASPAGGALRGIIRLSGDDALPILERCLVAPTDRLEAAAVCRQQPSRRQAKLDLAAPLGTVSVAVLTWPTAGSYTGQPAAELHLPGAMPVLAAAVERLIAAGARPARPGEFTLRAFLAGRLDLTQAEAVLGVIDAEDPAALQMALNQLAGGIGKPLQLLRGRLLDLLSHVEAGLDFVEEDIAFIEDAALLESLRQISRPLAAIADQLRHRDRSDALPLVILRGKPNAGKSRLLNALCQQETAIVAGQAGTTRDPIDSLAQCGPLTVRLTDTAGIETATSEIDQEAQDLGAVLERQADLRLWCLDLSQPPALLRQELASLPAPPATDGSIPTLIVGTKADLAEQAASTDLAPHGNESVLATSSLTGEGLERLTEAIAGQLERQDREETRGVAGTAARCQVALQRAQESLQEAITLVEAGGDPDLAAAEMRLALNALGEVTGEIYTDDILDRIFSRFCIGK